MVKIIDRYLNWDECNFNSYAEYEKIKNKIINDNLTSIDDIQKAYSMVQKLRYYFNSIYAHLGISSKIIEDANEFNIYYFGFINKYYSKRLNNPKKYM